MNYSVTVLSYSLVLNSVFGSNCTSYMDFCSVIFFIGCSLLQFYYIVSFFNVVIFLFFFGLHLLLVVMQFYIILQYSKVHSKPLLFTFLLPY